MAEFKTRMKFLDPEKVNEMMAIDEVANDEILVAELFAYSMPGKQIIQSYELYKKKMIPYDTFRSNVVEQFREIQENAPPPSQKKPKNEPKINKFDKPTVVVMEEKKPMKANQRIEKIEENPMQLSKKSSTVEKQSAGGPPNKKVPKALSNNDFNPFGGPQNNEIQGQNNMQFDNFGSNNMQFDNPNFNQFQHPNNQFNTNNQFDTNNNQFNANNNQLNTNTNQYEVNNNHFIIDNNQFNTNNEIPKAEARPTIKKKDSNAEFKPSHPSNRDLPPKIPSKQEIKEENQQNDFGGNFNVDQGNGNAGFAGFNDFFNNNGTEFQYVTQFDNNNKNNFNAAPFPDMNAGKTNAFQQESAGIKKITSQVFGSNEFPGFEPPQFQFEVGGDNEFSKVNTANHSFKEDDNPFRNSKEIENSGAGAFNFNFDGGAEPQTDWNNFQGPVETIQIKPEGGFPQNHWEKEEDKEEMKENYIPERDGNQMEWGDRNEWNFNEKIEVKDKNIGNMFDKQMEDIGQKDSPQFVREVTGDKNNVIPMTLEKQNMEHMQNWNNNQNNDGMGWGNEQNHDNMTHNWGDEHNNNMMPNVGNEPNNNILENFGHTDNTQNWGDHNFNNDGNKIQAWGNEPNTQAQGWGNNEQPNSAALWGNEQPNVQKINEINNSQPKSNEINSALSKPNELNSAQQKSKKGNDHTSQRSLSNIENDFGNQNKQGTNVQSWGNEFGSQNFPMNEQNQEFQNNNAQNWANEQNIHEPNFQNQEYKWPIEQNPMDVSQKTQPHDKSQNNIFSQQNLNVSQNLQSPAILQRQASKTKNMESINILSQNNLNVSLTIPNPGILEKQFSQHSKKVDSIDFQNINNNQQFFNGVEEPHHLVQYPSLPNSDAFNFHSYHPNQNPNNLNINNFNAFPNQIPNELNNMNAFANNQYVNNEIQNININNQPMPNLLDDVWGKEENIAQKGWVDFNDNITNDVPLSDNFSVPPINKPIEGSKQLNMIFNNSIRNPLVKPIENQANLMDFDDLIPTKDQIPPNFTLQPNNEIFNNNNGFQFPETVNIMDQKPFDMPQPSQSNAGYHYPSLNPADLMNFKSMNSSNLKNVAASAHMTDQTNMAGPSDFQSNKHTQIYNFLDNMNVEQKVITESKVTHNLINNVAINQTGNDLNKIETVKIINEFNKEKEEMLSEMKKLRQGLEELKEQKLKATPQIQVTPNDILNKDSIFSPFFPEKSQEKSQEKPNEETKILKEKIDFLTEEVKRLNTSINASPNKAENPINSISPVKNANQSMNESFLNSFEPEIKPNTYSYTTIFRKKQPMSQNNSRSNCSIIGNFNFYTISIGRKQKPITNLFLLEKPRSLNGSSVFTKSRKGPNFYKENLHSEDYVDENSFETPNKKNQKMQKIEIRNKDWREFMKLTNNSEILLNIDNFKYSCLYKKGVLFENEIYQVGVVFDNDLKGNVGFSIFFGNKTKEDMTNCGLNLKELNDGKTNTKINGVREVIQGNSQLIVEVTFFNGKSCWEKVIMEFNYR